MKYKLEKKRQWPADFGEDCTAEVVVERDAFAHSQLLEKLDGHRLGVSAKRRRLEVIDGRGEVAQLGKSIETD